MSQANPRRGAVKWFMAGWILLLGCLALLWSIGRLQQTGAEVFIALIGVIVVGGAFCFGKGLLKFKSVGVTISLVNLLVGVAACAASAVFIFDVLSNEDSAIEVHGPKPYANPNVVFGKFRLLNLNVLHGARTLKRSRFRDISAQVHEADLSAPNLDHQYNSNMANGCELDLLYRSRNGSWNHIGWEAASSADSRSLTRNESC